MQNITLHKEFRNTDYSGSRNFPGIKAACALRKILSPRSAQRLDLNIGDIIHLKPLSPTQQITLLVFDEKGQNSPSALNLRKNIKLSCDDFDSDELMGWILSSGGIWTPEFDAVTIQLSELAVLTTRTKCTAWIIRPISIVDFAAKNTCGEVEVMLKHENNTGSVNLPAPLGAIRDEFTVKKGTAISYVVEPGEFIQIIDVEGQQCSDFTAFRQAPLDQGLELSVDGTATRSMVRGSYPQPGLLDKFFDADLNPMLRVVQDTCGRHDTFGVACTARGYEERGFPGHVNCSDNISAVLEQHGVQKRTAWPAINFFWNTWIDEHSHKILTEESYSRPGDYVVMEALDQLVCATTACPDDLDPINGWNPTDIHVRIYKTETTIPRAIAHRQKEDAPMSITQESPFHPATSKLTSQYSVARDVWAPTCYPSVGTIGEYWACRENVTIQDMSSLRKYDIVGPDAEALLQLATTKNMSRLSIWRGTYALMCDESGQVIDDGTLFRLGHELFRWCCGSEESARALRTIATERNFQVRIHGMGSAMPNLSLQGPKSRELLKTIVFTQPTVPSLDELKWFGATIARIGDRDGIPFMLTRSGYTGDLGYELFCAASDAENLWNTILEAGQKFGIVPMGSEALNILRIEAGLAAANAEFAPGIDAFEAGLGFAVDLRKDDFVGKSALTRNSENPRRVQKGLIFEGNDVPASGATVYADERPVGIVTSAIRSPQLGRTIALALMNIEHSNEEEGVAVGQMDGHIKRLPAKVVKTPFFDPERKRARG